MRHLGARTISAPVAAERARTAALSTDRTPHILRGQSTGILRTRVLDSRTASAPIAAEPTRRACAAEPRVRALGSRTVSAPVAAEQERRANATAEQIAAADLNSALAAYPTALDEAIAAVSPPRMPHRVPLSNLSKNKMQPHEPQSGSSRM